MPAGLQWVCLWEAGVAFRAAVAAAPPSAAAGASALGSRSLPVPPAWPLRLPTRGPPLVVSAAEVEQAIGILKAAIAKLP